MKRILSIGVLALASACATAPDVAMKIENSRDKFDILLGSFDGSLALVHGNPKNATISATNGELTCDGVSTTGQFSTDMSKNKVKHNFSLKCSDGRTGRAVLTITARPDGYGLAARGAGIGSLNDGSRVKIVVGEASGTLGW